MVVQRSAKDHEIMMTYQPMLHILIPLDRTSTSLPGETGDIADTGDTGGPLGGLVTSCRGETRSVTYTWQFAVFGRGSFSCQTCDISGKDKVIVL